MLKQEKSPRDRRSYKRQLVLHLFYAGAPVRALEILDDDTTLLIEDELNKLMVDYYAYRLRWNRYSFTRDTQAHKDLQQLLSEMNKKLEQLQTSTDQYNRIRLHQDYIVALKKNNQPHEVIRQYRLLKQREQLNIENISDYVLLNVASAWLDIKEPDEAVKLYRYLLDKNPDNFRIKQALSYALMDINEPEQAIELVEKLNNSTPLWRKDHSGEVSRFNPEKQEAQIQLATILAFADQLEHAQTLLEKLRTQAPYNIEVRENLALVYRWRGWPEKSRNELAIAETFNPDYLYTQIKQAYTLLNLYEFPEADKKINTLNK